MKEVQGDIWDYHDKGNWIVITTNGTIKSNRALVMGRGIALQAKQKFQDQELDLELGIRVKTEGNHCLALYGYNLFTFPVKHNWWDKADLSLIEQSCIELINLVPIVDSEFTRFHKPGLDQVYLVRPGCGNGGLMWQDVKLVLEKYLDDRYIVVENKPL